LILAVGETSIGTGYARILDALLARLHGHFQIEEAVFRFDERLEPPARPIHQIDGGSRAAECEKLLRVIRKRAPAVLLINHDLSIVTHFLDVFDQVRSEVRIVVYAPIDGVTLDPGIVRALLRVHHVVLYTREQAEYLRSRLARDAARSAWEPLPVVSDIGVGLDTNVFQPDHSRLPPAGRLLDRRAVRRALFGSDDLRDAFIVLNGNRNIFRKRVDLTIEAFARFAADKPNSVRLCLHMAPWSVKGWHLSRLVGRQSLAGQVSVEALGGGLPSIPVNDLVLLYNACDVGVNTSTVEGWGLVNLEHGATGAAQIVPDHSVLPRVWGDSALRVRTYRSLVTDVPYQDEWTVVVEDLAAKLDALYQDRALLETMSAAAFAHANRPEFGWSACVAQWQRLLRDEVERANVGS